MRRYRHPNCPRQNCTADIGIPIAPDKTVQQISASQLPQTKLYSRYRHPNCPRQNCTADIGIPIAPDKTVQQISASQLPQTKLYSRYQHPNCPRQNCTADIGIPIAPDKTVQQTSASQLPQTKLYSRHRHPNCPRQNCTADIGIPTAPDKTVQPTQVTTFLGLELDSVAMEVRLPVDKLNRCTTLIQTCSKKDKIQLKPLHSITGTLNFACGAVVPGRPFLRRLISLTIGVTRPCHYIRITHEVREDLKISLIFLQAFNGKSLMLPQHWHRPVYRRVWKTGLRCGPRPPVAVRALG